jgi:hypothetical protein
MAWCRKPSKYSFVAPHQTYSIIFILMWLSSRFRTV